MSSFSKNLLLFSLLFLFGVVGFVLADGETDSMFFGGFERSGHQDELYLRAAIPSGDALREAGLFLMDLQNYAGDVAISNDEYLEKAQILLDKSGSCKGPETCAYDSQIDACRPTKLCDLDGIDSAFTDLQNSNQWGTTASSKYFGLFNKPELVSEDIYKLGDQMFAQTASSTIHYYYKDFYNDFNQLLAPYIVPTYTLPDKNSKYANELERVKRKLDFARFGFHACVTPTITDSEIKSLDEGETLFKEPLRIDFLQANQANLPDEPTNNLDYFCYSYQDF